MQREKEEEVILIDFGDPDGGKWCAFMDRKCTPECAAYHEFRMHGIDFVCIRLYSQFHAADKMWDIAGALKEGLTIDGALSIDIPERVRISVPDTIDVNSANRIAGDVNVVNLGGIDVELHGGIDTHET